MSKLVSVEYLNIPSVKESLLNESQVYRKTEITQLLIPSENDVGKPFDTYVKDGDSFRKESSNIIDSHSVIARNPVAIGKDSDGQDIYNEWLVPSEKVKENYGEHVIGELLKNSSFGDYQKKATIKAVKLTQELAEEITGIPGGDTIHIKVSWSDEPMIAKVGDYLTDQGYSISDNDMNAYAVVESEIKKERKSPSVDFESPELK